MLGDTDRQRSADLQQVDNPAFTPADDSGEPAEPMAEPAEKQPPRGTVFAVSPEVLAFGRMPKAAHLLVVAAFIINGTLWYSTLPFMWGKMTGYPGTRIRRR